MVRRRNFSNCEGEGFQSGPPLTESAKQRHVNEVHSRFEASQHAGGKHHAETKDRLDCDAARERQLAPLAMMCCERRREMEPIARRNDDHDREQPGLDQQHRPISGPGEAAQTTRQYPALKQRRRQLAGTAAIPSTEIGWWRQRRASAGSSPPR